MRRTSHLISRHRQIINEAETEIANLRSSYPMGRIPIRNSEGSGNRKESFVLVTGTELPRKRDCRPSEKSSHLPQKGNGRSDFRGKKPSPSGIEQNRQKAEGRCFNCNEVGHFTRNRPSNNRVKAGGSKPPGMTLFSAEIEMDGEVLDAPVEILDGLPVGMEAIELGAHQPWCGSCYRPDSDLPMWMDNRNFGAKLNKWLEDAYSLQAAYVLTKCAPYYGDQFA